MTRWRVRLGDLVDRWLEELPPRRRMALGPRGEAAAARHLRRSGYRILARNYRAAGAEIDLVALDHATLVFVEVKTRRGAGMGRPVEAVDQRKQEHIRRAARAYMAEARIAGRPTRFDVVAITGAGRRRQVEIVKDAF